MSITNGYGDQWTQAQEGFVFFCGIVVGFALGALLVGLLWWLL